MGFDLGDGTGAGSDSGEDSVHEARPITVRKKKREITDPKPWYATLVSVLHVACVVCGGISITQRALQEITTITHPVVPAGRA